MSRGARRRQRQQPRTLQVFLIIVLILLTACVAVKAFFLKAPEQKVDELPSQPSSTGDPQLSEEEQAAQEALRSHLERKGGFYTILVAALTTARQQRHQHSGSCGHCERLRLRRQHPPVTPRPCGMENPTRSTPPSARAA